jgi:hypothetical protein
MTNNPNQNATIDDVLNAIAAAPQPPDAKLVRAWTAKYPEFASAIIDFVTDWVEMDATLTNHVVTAEEVDLVVNRTMSRVQTMLDQAARPDSLSDLAADIQAAGHDLGSFQRAVGIDRSMLDSLIARLVKPATIPTDLVRNIATALNRSLDLVRDYLRLQPQPTAAFKSRKRPEVTQSNFAYFVRHAELSDQEKTRWLEAASDPELRG